VRLQRREPPLLFAGYSYGARAALRLAAAGFPVDGLLLLAPARHVPRTARDFGNLLLGRPLADSAYDPRVDDDLATVHVPVHLLRGHSDPIANESANESAPVRSPFFEEVLPGLNHFFSRGPGAGPTARDLLDPALDRALEALLTSSRRP
jgi:hypothetical protein